MSPFFCARTTKATVALSKKKIDTMRSRIRAVSDRFLYTGTRGDAFDYLMMDLRDRASSLLSSSIN